jgi:hypothetical protein
MVLAVYIYMKGTNGQWREEVMVYDMFVARQEIEDEGGKETYATACSGTWTGMPYGIVSYFLCLRGLAICEVFAVGLESRYDVELGCTFA